MPMALKDKSANILKHQILQTLLATIILFILFLALGQEKLVLISTIGATTFIVFMTPMSKSAKTKNIIISHLIGLAVGTCFYYTTLPYFVEYPSAIGGTILVMVILGIRHAPAAGTALAVTMNGQPLNAFIAIMLCAIVLSQCHYYLKKYLKDLS